MVEVRLHGALARDFGRVWHLAIETVREAVEAIEANRPGFMAKIMDLSNRGMVYRVRSKNHDYDDNDVSVKLGSIERVDIIPIVAGASAGVRFVVGAALVISTFIPGSPTFGNPIARAVGASLMIGAVTEWLTPVPKRQEATKSLESWTVSGPTNTVDQGLPVPIIYGEVLAGGYAISAGLSAAQLTPGGSVGPDASIGGNLNPVANTGSGGLWTSVAILSAGAFNMDEPYGYTWSYTGFAGAAAVRLIGQGTASIRLEVDTTLLGDGVTQVFTGSVTVAITGIVPNSSSGGATATSASDTKTVTMTIITDAYNVGVGA